MAMRAVAIVIALAVVEVEGAASVVSPEAEPSLFEVAALLGLSFAAALWLVISSLGRFMVVWASLDERS